MALEEASVGSSLFSIFCTLLKFCEHF